MNNIECDTFGCTSVEPTSVSSGPAPHWLTGIGWTMFAVIMLFTVIGHLADRGT